MEEINIKEIDSLIEDSQSYNDSTDFLNLFAEKILPYLGIDISLEINSLVNKEITQNNKRIISFCLLRIYSIKPSLITKSFIKHNIHSLILESCPEVANKLAIQNKTETYEKESKFSNYIKNNEKSILEKINVFIDLSSLNAFENAYKSTLNNKIYKPIINIFINQPNFKTLLDRFLNILKGYIDCQPNDKYRYYEASIKAIDSLLEIPQVLETKYSIDYIQKPFLKIKESLINDFRANPLSQPAKLTVINTEKKYPFHKGEKYRIQLLVKNDSSGLAYNTVLDITDTESISIIQKKHFIGEVKKSTIVEIEYESTLDSKSVLIEGSITWNNFDDKERNSKFFLELDGQKNNINWEELQEEEPYDLEPVTRENEFIGRKKIFSDLKKTRKKVGSSYVYGQRRVGKTSIVKTLESSIETTNLLIIYLEAGDWNNANSPRSSMNDLGYKICNKIKKFASKFNSIEIPNFEGSFNRISNFLDEVIEIDDTFRLLIILDEFDRISNELLNEGEIAQSFMLTIRSISNREQLGFILVGGEKMEFILSQWQEFNKFKPIRVDYFDKESEWDDFKKLIKSPINDVFDITDSAIDYIYNQTSGNPYFTKKICIELFSLMVTNRDSHITKDEAEKATFIARDSSNIGSTDFSHFWKDGIKEKEDKEEEISVNRRKILLSMGQILKGGRKATRSLIIDKSISNGLSELQAEKTLEEFVQRKIISTDGGNYTFIVKFFSDWLISNGLNKIITTFQEEQRIIMREQYEEEIKIKPNEINKLSRSWRTYKGKEITTDIIREWLEQFETIEDQRLVFRILENLRIYSGNEVREKLEDLFKEVKKEIRKSDKVRILSEGKRKREDILISYLDKNPVKSGANYARLFAEVNNIYKDNSCPPDKIGQKLKDLKNISSLVFIDDLIGTGNSIIENLGSIIDNYCDLLKSKNIVVVICVITGFQEAKQRIEDFALKASFPLTVKLIDPLDNSHKCFNNESLIFTAPLEREKAKIICEKIGLELEKKHPLGYNNCQATIVFPDTCPNNSLPILWKETNQWIPLFNRK